MLTCQPLAHHNTPIKEQCLSQFKNWTHAWMQSSQQTASKEHNIRQFQASETPSSTQKAMIYLATFQKFDPRSRCNSMSLGDFIWMRKCLDTLEPEIFQEYCQRPSYVRPSKRLPSSPDKFSRKRPVNKFKRPSFASSTLVYISSGSTGRIQPIQNDDDDDVPLGKLVFYGTEKLRFEY